MIGFSLARAFLVLAACGATELAAARDLPQSIYEAGYGWEQERTRDSCAVRREFGSGSDAVLLAMRQYFPGHNVRTTVAASELENAQRRALRPEPTVWLYPAELEIALPAYFRIESEDGPSGLVFTLPAAHDAGKNEAERDGGSYADLRKADLLVFEDVFARDIGLAIGPMDKVVDFMENCTKQLVAGWGLDPDEQEKRTRWPEPIDRDNLVRLIAQESPVGPLRRNQPGRVNLRVLVDEQGKPSECFVEPPVLPEYREAACEQILKYARFKPALDANGQPMASYFVTSIVYAID